MTSVGVDVGVMWRLSEDFNRRFVARVQHHHRPGVSMLYNGKTKFYFLASLNCII